MPTDTPYFRHDANARNDPKIRAMIKKYGTAGYGRYWMIVETMRETRGYKFTLKKYVLSTLAEQMLCTVEELQAFIKDCVNEFELFIQEDGFVYSESLIERMAVLDALRAARQKGAYAMHAKQHHNITKDGREPLD